MRINSSHAINSTLFKILNDVISDIGYTFKFVVYIFYARFTIRLY